MCGCERDSVCVCVQERERDCVCVRVLLFVIVIVVRAASDTINFSHILMSPSTPILSSRQKTVLNRF